MSAKEKCKMKKILLALLAGLMIFSFSACGNTAENAEDSDNAAESVTFDSNLETDNDEPRYTSDGELIVEEELPASDSDLTE